MERLGEPGGLQVTHIPASKIGTLWNYKSRPRAPGTGLGMARGRAGTGTFFKNLSWTLLTVRILSLPCSHLDRDVSSFSASRGSYPTPELQWLLTPRSSRRAH